jgi:hypothetical protein
VRVCRAYKWGGLEALWVGGVHMCAHGLGSISSDGCRHWMSVCAMYSVLHDIDSREGS